jgi:2-oxoglutarate ferredoxin oxidoreductase subunit alpha
MTEYAGLAYFAEVPIVVWDVQRMGPSTGLPTRTSQGDLTFTYFLGHGDTQTVILFPGTVNECFEFGFTALDIAEHLQTPVFVLSDLDLGMNQWMTETFRYPDKPLDRGKVLWEEDLEKINGEWGRYRDVDGDGIPYRTIPGNRHTKAGYFSRGTGHNENAVYSENSNVWKTNMDRLRLKYRTARSVVPKPIIDSSENSEIGIITYGSNEPSVYEARALLNKEGLPSDYLRIRALPFTDEVTEFVQSHKKIYIVETNHDGQMKQLITIEMPDQAIKFRSICLGNGLSLSASWVKNKIQEMEAK